MATPELLFYPSLGLLTLLTTLPFLETPFLVPDYIWLAVCFFTGVVLVSYAGTLPPWAHMQPQLFGVGFCLLAGWLIMWTMVVSETDSADSIQRKEIERKHNQELQQNRENLRVKLVEEQKGQEKQKGQKAN